MSPESADSFFLLFIVLPIFVLLFVVLRELWCWYWKINQGLELLTEIRDSIKDIKMEKSKPTCELIFSVKSEWFEGFNGDYNGWIPKEGYVENGYMTLQIDKDNKSEGNSSIKIISVSLPIGEEVNHLRFAFRDRGIYYKITPDSEFSFDWFLHNKNSHYISIDIIYHRVSEPNEFYTKIVYGSHFSGDYPDHIMYENEETGKWLSHKRNLFDDLKNKKGEILPDLFIERIVLKSAFPKNQEVNYDYLLITNLELWKPK